MPTTPPLSRMAQKRSSGRLRVCAQTVRLFACEAITGPSPSRTTSHAAASDRCDTSGSIRCAYSARTKARPCAVSPCVGASQCEPARAFAWFHVSVTYTHSQAAASSSRRGLQSSSSAPSMPSSAAVFPAAQAAHTSRAVRQRRTRSALRAHSRSSSACCRCAAV